MVATGEAVQDFVEYADQKVADGTMDKTRFLFPTVRRLRKWLFSVFDDKDGSHENADDVMKPNFSVVFMGDSFGAKKDPEHLPATNAWQHFGNGLRVVSRLLGSEESMFGFRVACATMTVAIVCFLRVTQSFFQEQRLVWAMIIIAMGMTQSTFGVLSIWATAVSSLFRSPADKPASGQSIFGFFCRIGGSFLAMVFSYIIWYIVDEKTPGIIVFMWLFIFVEYYFFVKYPRFVPATLITIVTQVLIIAYELEVRKIGVAAAQSVGQRYYPTYELAPYRLLTVAGGSLVAFFWTVFPRPMTDRAWLRRDLSATMYVLANYFSVINETLRTALHGTGGAADVPGTPAYRLMKIRQKLFSKLMLLLPSLQLHSDWQKWEPTIGGKFPRSKYEEIILRSGRIQNYLTLISYTVTWKPRHAPERMDDAWLKALSELIKSIGPTHYTILSTLAMLSNSLLSGQSLPPYIPLPRPYELTRQLLALKRPARAPSNSHSTRGGGGGGDDAVPGSTSVSRTGSSYSKQAPRRRNSMWGKPNWRPEKATHSHEEGGLYERQDESDMGGDAAAAAAAVVITTSRGGASWPTSPAAATASGADGRERANWRDVAERSVSTATGMPVLQRIPTGVAADLGVVLDARNMEQHGYTEFAVLQVCSTLVCDDLEGMIQAVAQLVGVMDFSFRMDTSEPALDDDGGGGKKDN